jgi:hypothetical protein
MKFSLDSCQYVWLPQLLQWYASVVEFLGVILVLISIFFSNCASKLSFLTLSVIHSLKVLASIYSETSIHRFRWGSEEEAMDPGKQWMWGAIVEIEFAQGP